ncbi:MAG TPA: VanZ family protein [Noviherbaspirillum sp.]
MNTPPDHAGKLHRTATLLFSPRMCAWSAALLYTAMLVIGSIPGKAEAASAAVPDKLLHLVAYSLLSALVYGAMAGKPLLRALRTLVIVAVLGALDEGLQSLLPYRNAGWDDWRVDVIAALLITSTFSLMQAMRPALTTNRKAKEKNR